MNYKDFNHPKVTIEWIREFIDLNPDKNINKLFNDYFGFIHFPNWRRDEYKEILQSLTARLKRKKEKTNVLDNCI